MASTFQDRVSGISTSVAVKAPVRVATTADITLSGEQTIDGIAVVADDRVLVKDQSDDTENGIYVANTSSWSRAEDFDGTGDAVKGTRVWILEGTANGEEEYNLTSANPVVIGTDSITWAQSPLQDAVDAAQAAQTAAQAAAGSVDLPPISGGDAGKALKVNAGEDAFELTASALGTAALLDVGTAASKVVQLTAAAKLPAVDGSLLTNLAADLPPGFLFGLALSNDTDTDHDIAIATGECRDSSDTYNMTLSAVLTKQIDASWVAGDDAGGMFTGSVANDTWYHVFLIRKDSDGSIDAGFDTSISAANIPAGYTAYRRMGSVLTDASANINQFRQNGDYFKWVDNVQDKNAALQSSGAETLALTVPTGFKAQAHIYPNMDGDSTNDYWRLWDPDDGDDDVAIDATNCTGEINPGHAPAGDLTVFTNTSAQVLLRCSNTRNCLLMTLGWTDRRGKDA